MLLLYLFYYSVYFISLIAYSTAYLTAYSTAFIIDIANEPAVNRSQTSSSSFSPQIPSSPPSFRPHSFYTTRDQRLQIQTLYTTSYLY